jgi:NAD(P)H dehydrogenase (quinone)
MMIGITGATGKLGRLVIDDLLRTTSASQIVAIARDPAKANDLTRKGIAVRYGDYNVPESLGGALAGIGRLLLISSSEVGRRVEQHRAVITAARHAGAGLVAYTSLLHAITSPLLVRKEHVLTEQILAESGVPFVLLRNGWYTENYTGALAEAMKTGEMIDDSGEGKISAAARADYAAGAAAVLRTQEDQAGRIYELAGDDAFTLAEFAANAARQSGRNIVYRNLSESEYKAALVAKGIPEPAAALFAANNTGIAQGGLFDSGRQLSRLIGRPTTPWTESVLAALKTLGDQKN